MSGDEKPKRPRRYPMLTERRECVRCDLTRARGDLKCKRCGSRTWRTVPAPGQPKKP